MVPPSTVRRLTSTLAAGVFFLALAFPAFAAAEADPFFAALNAPLTAEELSGQRAMGADTKADLAAGLDHNHIGRADTGDSQIGGAAFQHATGWVNVIQNSGNQVVIQNAVTVTVNVYQ